MTASYTQTGDVLSLPKSGIGSMLVTHKILRVNDGFIHNHPDTGVAYVNPNEIDFAAAEIEEFTGSDREAKNIAQRAKRRIGKPYHAKDYNCEHFVNEVRFGVAKSPQADSANTIANTALSVGTASILFSGTKNPSVKKIAYIGIGIGLLIKLILHMTKS
jgi:hypothetical protein